MRLDKTRRGAGQAPFLAKLTEVEDSATLPKGYATGFLDSRFARNDSHACADGWPLYYLGF
jgi:hypothetical protein